jgi:hypothetical protein
VKGGCSPQNILESADVLTELAHACNRFLNDLKRFFFVPCNKMIL